MFDIGMSELLVIGIVALIVVGPKDLPGMFRTLGRFTARMKGMAREFTRAMEDAADETGVKDIGKDLRAVTDPRKMGLDRLNAAADKFEKWQPGRAAKATGPQNGRADAPKAGAEKAAPPAERRTATKPGREGAATRPGAPVPDPGAPTSGPVTLEKAGASEAGGGAGS
jgi:sec-independent protein translocase protein TatB